MVGKEIKEKERDMDKGPFQTIKSLLKVNFKDHVVVYAPHFLKVEKILLKNDGIVSNYSIS